MLQFWCLLGAMSTSIFDQFSWPPKSLELQQLSCEGFLFTIWGLPFWLQKSIKNLFVFTPPSWNSFFLFYLDFLEQVSNLGPFQNPVGAKTRSDHVASKWPNTSCSTLIFFLYRTTLIHAELVALWLAFGWLLGHFGTLLECFARILMTLRRQILPIPC